MHKSGYWVNSLQVLTLRDIWGKLGDDDNIDDDDGGDDYDGDGDDSLPVLTLRDIYEENFQRKWWRW